MEDKWTIPLDISGKYQPVISVVIKRYKPFEYAITLKILEGNLSRNVIRWDNINHPDHIDKFYKYKENKKHLKSPIGMISNLNDVTKLCNYIDKNHTRMIKNYFKR